MESDFVIFDCASECKTIRLAIYLVCLICNISLLHETQRLVAFRVASILGSFGKAGPWPEQGHDRSAAK